MKITKFGHSCFLVEEGNARLLVDPGVWSEDISGLNNIDALFISHEHQDHLDLEKIKTLVQNNTEMIIYTNSGVGQILGESKIIWTEVANGQKITIKEIPIEVVGERHAEIYPKYAKSDIPNTGFLFAGQLYYPGDSFSLPNKRVEVLALPICAPWLKLSEVVDFVKAVKPHTFFPVHDAMLKLTGPFYKNAEALLVPEGIQMFVPEIGISFTV